MKKRAADPEHQKRRGAGIAAYRNTPEAKAAVSAHALKLWSDPEHRARRLAGMREAWVRRKAAAARAELPAPVQK